jgi:hypothetical protein
VWWSSSSNSPVGKLSYLCGLSFILIKNSENYQRCSSFGSCLVSSNFWSLNLSQKLQ